MSESDVARGPAEERFHLLAARYVPDSAVSQGTGFGSSPGLRVGGKIFAMLAGGALVVKLPKPRVDELVASGAGSRFDPGHGRVMREWLAVAAARVDMWDELASEAFSFVSARS